MRKTLLTFIVTMLTFAVTPAQDLTDETLLMTFIPNVQFAPMYVAIADGYFEEQGFNVTLEYLNEPDVVDLVAAGQQRFGIVSGEQVILAGTRGRPITYVYSWFQQYPVGIIYDATLDLTSPEDLAGATIGIPGRFGASYFGVGAILNAAGLTEQDITLEEIGFAAPEVLCTGRVQAASVYLNNEPLQVAARIAAGDCGDLSEIQTFAVADVADLVSNGIITNRATVEDDPEVVANFVAAFHAGLLQTMQNPARAYLTSETFVEGLPMSDELRDVLEELAAEREAMLADAGLWGDELRDANQADLERVVDAVGLDAALQFNVLVRSIELWYADEPGMTTLGAWQQMTEAMQAVGQLEETPDLEALFTNEFVPAEANRADTD